MQLFLVLWLLWILMDFIVLIRVNGNARREIIWAIGFIKRSQTIDDEPVDDDMVESLDNKDDYSRECARDGIKCDSFGCWQRVQPHKAVCKMDCECYKCVYGACPPSLKNKE